MVTKKTPITLEEYYLLEGNRLLLLEELSNVIANSLALTTVALESDIPNYKPQVIHEYFGTMDTLLQKTQELCVQLINTYFESKIPLKNELKITLDSVEAENSQSDNILSQ
jgi:hypothetical protein